MGQIDGMLVVVMYYFVVNGIAFAVQTINDERARAGKGTMRDVAMLLTAVGVGLLTEVITFQSVALTALLLTSGAFGLSMAMLTGGTAGRHETWYRWVVGGIAVVNILTLVATMVIVKY
ncbi:MAG: hypothetical protein II951_05795 [Bacteroidales bacterium]|jgi:hypothetical protein|nr:hypothetical protein [Bacteroidales bacterium]